MKTKTVILGSTLIMLSTGLTACSLTNSTETTSSAVTSVDTEEANTEYFSSVDLTDTYDAAAASTINLSGTSATASGDGVSVDGSVVTISSGGTYILSGESNGVQLLITAADTDTVQVVVTSAEGSKNSLEDSADRTATDYSAAIYSKSAITFNGSGELTVTGNYNNAIKGKKDIKFTGGTYTVTSTVKHAVSANDNLSICDTTMTLSSVKSALYADNEDDTSLGNVYIQSGNFIINAGKKGVHASNNLTVDGGSFDIQSSFEGFEGKVVTINDGEISIVASDDGMNATDWASTAGEMQAQEGVSLVINGGIITITADGDGIDSNNDLTITGGTITVNGPTSNGDGALDYDGTATITGGTFMAIGSAGMAQGLNGEASTQMSFKVDVSGSEGDTITVKDANGETIYTYTATRVFGNIVLSASDLKEGETYTIEVNG
ncbi:carbohydrate-binding domain-containing protein [Streptococcus moroccensis]|uniref:Carbohydrate-binding domain-containing protein n=1 Tax=Streptococcus moroccensis TaxID=1451356 RepID=A0ABT9YUY7_9STRE|nr:carbohydrate-binding domain-containing protein [Streptococcus moroccensis]MDQ0223417.1 hypothetical protein [Streptococcus moroccensis]